MTQSTDGSYYAKGDDVWKHSSTTNHDDGTSSTTLGFHVCTVNEFIDPDHVAEILTAGELFGDQFLALAQHLGCDRRQLAGLDLVAMREALKDLVETIKAYDLAGEIDAGMEDKGPYEIARQVLAQLPEKKP